MHDKAVCYQCWSLKGPKTLLECNHHLLRQGVQRRHQRERQGNEGQLQRPQVLIHLISEATDNKEKQISLDLHLGQLFDN